MGPAAFYFGAAVILTILLWNGWTAAYFGMHMSQETPARRLKRRLKINAVSHLSGCCLHRANDCWLADLGQLSGPGQTVTIDFMSADGIVPGRTPVRIRALKLEQCRISASATIFVN